MPDADSPDDIQTHPVISKLVPNPGDLPNTAVLVGYLGPSQREGFLRLYLDLDFRAYFEIPKEGVIIYAEPVDPSSEAKPTRIVIDASRKIEFVQIVETAFLQGGIVSAFPVGMERRPTVIIPPGIARSSYPCTKD
jgi:hypothetical protein